MAETAYNTNLASEFYVLSVLHRLGVDAVLTLGNKKSVDIMVARGQGDSVTVDVKGLAGKTAWPVDNVKTFSADHYLIFVCYFGRIRDPNQQPEVWVFPSTELTQFIHTAPGGRRIVQRRRLLKDGQKYRDAWGLISPRPVGAEPPTVLGVN